MRPTVRGIFTELQHKLGSVTQHGRRDRRGVTPIIAIILMISLTVILSGVVATFAFGLTEDISHSPPSPQFSFDYEQTNSGPYDGKVEILQTSGESVPMGQLIIRGEGMGVDDDTPFHDLNSAFSPDDELSVGDRVTIPVDRSHKIQIVWMSEDGSRGYTIAVTESPNL